MGVIMKGAHSHTHTHGNNIMHMNAVAQSSRRWNVLTVLVVVLLFGASVLGLMGLHSLRDKRLFNLLIKQKDHQILSLQFLCQKERERLQEYKVKINEMKMKTRSLRSQKAELMGRISEMESTISSLKDEQRTVELAFQEKENEAKFLKERYIQVMDQNTPRLKALTETLRQKEAEIEELKRHLKSPAESTDGLPTITEAKEYVSGRETAINTKKGVQSGEMMHEIIGEDFGSEKRMKNDDEKIRNDADDEEHKSGDHEHKQSRDGKILDVVSTSISNLEGSENEEVGVHKGGMKLETRYNSRKLRGKHSNGKFFQHMEIGNRLEEGKPIKDLQFGIDEQGSFKDNLRGYSKENASDNIEESSPGIKSQHNRPINTEDLSRNNIVANSNALFTHFSANDMPNNAKVNSETTELSVQQVEENDQSKDDQDTKNKHPIPGQTEVVEKNEYPAENELEDFEQTEVGVST